MPRGILPAPHGKVSAPPDIANYSWVEYGMRCGMPRLFDLFGRRAIKATAFMNAQCADVYAAAAEQAVAAGWDFVGHCWFQRSLKDAEDETAEIQRSLQRLEKLTGKPVRGWFGAGGGETPQTPEVLKRAGIEFTHDWLVDDLPCWMRTEAGPLLCLPYSWEINDVPMWVVQSQSSDEFLKRLEATLAVLERELDTNPRVLTLALHPHVVGVPHRMHYLEKAVDLLMRRSDTAFVTSGEIADWFVSADKTGRAELEEAMRALPTKPA